MPFASKPYPAPRLGLITVSVALGDAGLRDRICGLLGRCPGVVVFDACADVAELTAALAKRQPRVLLAGDDLPGAPGWNWLGGFSGEPSTLLGLAISAEKTVAHVESAFAAGAVGYLLTSSLDQLLQQALHDVVTGGSPMTPEVARDLVTALATPARPTGLLALLTKRERQILELLSLGTRYNEIATQLGLSRDTVHSHTKKIYRKLMVRSKTEAALILGHRVQFATDSRLVNLAAIA